MAVVAVSTQLNKPADAARGRPGGRMPPVETYASRALDQNS
jgi:hypothetical protein